MKVFWYHYNKNEARKAGKPQITVHYNKACHIVDNVVINVPTFGHIRKGEQPHFVVKGKCASFEVKEGVAYLN